jgi:hypothetical protein
LYPRISTKKNPRNIGIQGYLPKNPELLVSKDINQKLRKICIQGYPQKPGKIGIQGYPPETKKNWYPWISTKTRKVGIKGILMNSQQLSGTF